MLTEQDLIKIALEQPLPTQPDQEVYNNDPRKPVRKVYDAIVGGAGAALGGIKGTIAGLNSLDVKAPIKTID